MLFHMSIAAHEPPRVAAVIAQLWGGEALPFPPVSEGSWVAMAGDDRNTTVEVYPIDVVLQQGEGEVDAQAVRIGNPGLTPTHGAIATALSLDEVLAIAAREGWPAKYLKRGGLFGVVELWIEGRQMMEVLTPEMQAEYLASVTIPNWKAMLAAGRPG
jgi:hypothetical protein